MRNPPKAVVFDLDGTLVDSLADICSALNAALTGRGIPPLDRAAVAPLIGDGPKVLIERALAQTRVSANSTDIDALTAEFEEHYLTRGHTLSPLFDGARECLQRLARADTAIGLCSNKPDQLCRQFLHQIDLLKFFGAVRDSVAGMPNKPHPTVLTWVLEQLGVAPGSSLLVGDSGTDVATARAAGVPVALVSYGYTATPARELGADWVIDSLREVPSIGLRPKCA